jgi:integrase
MKLNNAVIGKLEPTQKGVDYYYDDTTKGFGVRITSSGVKTFILQKRMKCADGKVRLRRVSLARFGDVSTEQARKLALDLLLRIAGGEVIGDSRDSVPTMLDAVKAFMAARNHKPRTRFEYLSAFGLSLDFGRKSGPLADWLDRPVNSIGENDVERRYLKMADTSVSNANKTFRYLKAVMHYAQLHFEDSQGRALIDRNPVDRLTYDRKIYKVKRKKTNIPQSEFAAWFDAVMTFGSMVGYDNAAAIRDLVLLLVFTGLRISEARPLEWRYVNLTGATVFVDIEKERVQIAPRSFLLVDTKNREVVQVPMSGFVFELFERRKALEDADKRFVFHNRKSTHLGDIRKGLAKIISACGFHFTPHDLRRTFASRARALGYDVAMVGTLLHHKKRDVTEGYIVYEGLREPMERIAQAFLRDAGKTADNVVALKKTG